MQRGGEARLFLFDFMDPIGIWSQSSSLLIRACPGHHRFARAGRLRLPESIRRPSSRAGLRFLMQSIRVIEAPRFRSDADKGPYRRSLSVVRGRRLKDCRNGPCRFLQGPL